MTPALFHSTHRTSPAAHHQDDCRCAVYRISAWRDLPVCMQYSAGGKHFARDANPLTIDNETVLTLGGK